MPVERSSGEPKTGMRYEIVVSALKASEVRPVACVSEDVLVPLIRPAHAEPCIAVLAPARGEEALGTEHFAVTRRPR